MVMSTLLSIVLAAPQPFFHPDQPIVCPSYLPGSDVRVPPGVTYQYSPTELRAHLLRCYCETVKSMEQMCIRGGYGKRRCQQRTSQWIEDNLPLATSPGNQGANQGQPERRNVIINIQVNP